MQVEEIAGEYAFIFNRLKKLDKSIRGIAHQNTELKEANRKLRLEHDTWKNREAARERVLEKLNGRELVPTSEDIHP